MVVAGLVLIVVAAAVMVAAARATKRPVTRISAPAATTAVEAGTDHARHAGEADPQTLRQWLLRGINRYEALRWIEHGFDADHAYLLRSLDVDPATAARLRNAGLDDSKLVAFVEEASFRHRTSVDDLVALAERSPQLAPHAVAWMELGVDVDRALAYASVGFTAAASDTWRGAGWDMDAAASWFDAKFDATSAKPWRDAGFTAGEAQAWRGEHFGVRQACEWRRLGDTPERAREVEQRFRDARVTVTDGLQWLDRGFSVDDICDGRTAPATLRRVTTPRVAATLRGVPVMRDDLLSAAGQLARANGSPAVRHRLQKAAGAHTGKGPMEVPPELIDDVLAELQRLDDSGALGVPQAARALARRLARGRAASTGALPASEPTPAGRL